MSPPTLAEFMTTLTSSPHSHAISFSEFRDFLLLLPRKISAAEIYRFYEVKKFMGDDGRGAARVTMEGWFSVSIIRLMRPHSSIFLPGDVSLSAEDKPPMFATMKLTSSEAAPPVEPLPIDHSDPDLDDDDDFEDYDEEGDEEHHSWLEGHTALKFLTAGGIAGAGQH